MNLPFIFFYFKFKNIIELIQFLYLVLNCFIVKVYLYNYYLKYSIKYIEISVGIYEKMAYTQDMCCSTGVIYKIW